jgi:hypothetical protein
LENPKHKKQDEGVPLVDVPVYIFMFFAIMAGIWYARWGLNLRGWRQFVAGFSLGVGGVFLLFFILAGVASLLGNQDKKRK